MEGGDAVITHLRENYLSDYIPQTENESPPDLF